MHILLGCSRPSGPTHKKGTTLAHHGPSPTSGIPLPLSHSLVVVSVPPVSVEKQQSIKKQQTPHGILPSPPSHLGFSPRLRRGRPPPARSDRLPRAGLVGAQKRAFFA